MRWLYLLLVWIHLLAAITWIGSTVFLAVVLVPTLRRQGDPNLTARLMSASGTRLSRLSWLLFLILATTGVTLLALRGGGWDYLTSAALWRTSFGHALLAKLALFASILGLSFWHDFRLGPRATEVALTQPRSAEAGSLRRLASWCGRITLVLALLVAGLAVVLVRGWPL